MAPENVEDPAQVLIGLTSSLDAAQLADWPDGTLAEYALMPVAAVTPAERLEIRFHRARHDRPLYHSVRRPAAGRLAAGETLVVNGATGAYGTAAVFWSPWARST